MDNDIIRHFEKKVAQLEKEEASDFDLAEVMTDMESQFHIPLLADPAWNQENPRIIHLYQKLSALRKF